MSDQYFYYEDGELKYGDYDPDNIIAGDTDSVYVSLEKVFDVDANEKDVIAFADNVGKTVNASFPKFMKDAFNSSEDKSRPITTEREIVSDISYFIKKKNYAMRVIDSEGVKPKKGEDMKYTGLEIIKSDTSIVLQKALIELLDMILSFKSYEEIKAFYKGFEAEFRKQPINKIAKPVNLNTFVQYQEEYNKTGSFHGMPQQVKAALNYNIIASSKDKKLNAGDSIRICYVLHPKMNCIAFPADDIDTPSWIHDFEIDYTQQWLKLYFSKIERYLIPIGFDKESRRLEKVRNLLKFQGE